MNSNIKEIKMHIRYCKKALKILNKIYTWKWIPLKYVREELIRVKEQLDYYQKKLREIK